MSEKFNMDGSINENWFAEEIARRESKLEEVNIGQIKEIQKITLEILAEIRYEGDEGTGEFDQLIEKHRH